ncbi:MAG: DUF4493 domain-containing protein [Bacteroidota bacterium]
MKKNVLLPLTFLLSLTLACQEDPPFPADSPGSLSLSVDLTLTIHESGSNLKSTAGLEDFRVRICRPDSTVYLSFEQLSAMPDTVALEPGYYFVTVDSGNDLPAAFSNPYYYGSSGLFLINSGTHEAVSIVCTLANTVVSVNWSENVASAFDNYRAVVASPLDSLEYGSSETRYGYFRPLPLQVRVYLEYINPDGSEITKVLHGSIAAPLPNRHYRIEVDASVSGGSGSFQVTLDTTGLELEIIPVSETIEDEPDPVLPETGYGSLLITEIMYDPSALGDTEGEWIEIYNNSPESISLTGLLLVRDHLYAHSISSTASLAPGEFYVLARTATATNAVNQYVYGSAISLSNTGSLLEIYDGGSLAAPGELLFGVQYGTGGFPAASGSSICLDPGINDPELAILGASWCISSSVYSTGDHGTPGSLNDSCL